MPLRKIDHTSERNDVYSGSTVWHGAAFVLEAILLLLFLLISMAVFMSLFGHSDFIGQRTDELSRAVGLAQNTAEQFASDPSGMPESMTVDDEYEITCDVTPETTDAGTLYQAEIMVSKDGSAVYMLNTARYVSGG